ncbi:MAG: glycosyltransferase family 4 protein [Steroidobacteraceae bacterium]
MTGMRPTAASKIVFVNRYFYPDQSATSQLLTDLASALADSGLDVHVVCSRQRYDDSSARLVSKDSVGRVVVHRVWTSRFGRARLVGRAVDYATFYMSSGLALLRLLRRGDTVIAKTDPPLISIVAMLAAKLRGAQLINWLQDIFPEVASLLGANPLPPLLDSLLRRCRDLSLRAARTNVVLGERMRERLQLIGISPEKIRIVENWAEVDPETPKPASISTLRSRLGLGDQFVVGYSGNLGRAHEFQTLLDSAEILQNDTAIVFLMIGGGVGMTQLNRAVVERGLKNFRFLPYQPRESLGDCLAAADVHWVSLLPSLEGLIVPSKFYGILAAARPVIFIGDPDGELSRVIRAAQCGSAVSVGDIKGLVRALGDLKVDARRLEREGTNGYHRYCERYSARRAIEDWKLIVRA